MCVCVCVCVGGGGGGGGGGLNCYHGMYFERSFTFFHSLPLEDEFFMILIRLCCSTVRRFVCMIWCTSFIHFKKLSGNLYLPSHTGVV